MDSNLVTINLTRYDINDIVISFIDLARQRAMTEYHITENKHYDDMTIKIIRMMSEFSELTPTKMITAINKLISAAELLPTSMYVLKSLKQARAFAEVLDEVDEVDEDQIYRVEL